MVLMVYGHSRHISACILGKLCETNVEDMHLTPVLHCYQLISADESASQKPCN